MARAIYARSGKQAPAPSTRVNSIGQGTALTSAQALTAITHSDYGVNYAILADGSFLAVWWDNTTIYGRWFTSTGATSGSRFTIASGLYRGDDHVSVAVDATGNALIAYHAGEYSSEDVYAVVR